MQKNKVIVVGAGLAGSECAWQLAQRNIPVDLYEMRPLKRSPAHISDNFAELVCSNSFRSDNHESSAVGLMHYEMRRLKSLIFNTADAHKVPSGDALAVDRVGFSEAITNTIKNHPKINIIHEEFTNIDEKSKTNIVIIATGPLTSDTLSQEIAEIIGGEALNFFDAIAPIVYKDSIDFNHAWLQSRYDKNDSKDYINCELTAEEYKLFYQELISAKYMDFKDWEKDTPYFDGCLPVEIMASRGEQTLLFGPMKPVGLINPHTCKQPFSVVQLRQDNKLGTLYNIVGFQTKMKHSEQKRVFTMIPALKNAEFAKLGGIHKNTYINSPKLLNKDLSLKTNPNIYFAGQITGCEGYVESSSIGLICALFISKKINNMNMEIPAVTSLGSMLNHITSNANTTNYQPMNINFGLFPEIENTYIDKNGKKRKLSKKEKREALCKRAITSIETLVKIMN